MLDASFNLSPVAPVFPTFSEPAKSTKFITDNLSLLLPSSENNYLNSITITVCALDELAFINVAATDLCEFPYSILISIS